MEWDGLKTFASAPKGLQGVLLKPKYLLGKQNKNLKKTHRKSKLRGKKLLPKFAGKNQSYYVFAFVNPTLPYDQRKVSGDISQYPCSSHLVMTYS